MCRPQLCVDHTLFIHSSVDGYWGCFHHWAIENNGPLFIFFQVSCLCLEENVENDPCKFALTSRTGDVVETFVLHSSSPSVRQTWIHEINQILENQRNFLNGKCALLLGMCFLPRVYTFLFLFSPTAYE